MPNLIARSGIPIAGGARRFGLAQRDREFDAAAGRRGAGCRFGEIYALFPNLQERASTAHGTRLSGGEQQMLAIARILRTGARMLLLDKQGGGMAPVIVQQIGRTIREIKSRGFTVLLVEQNFRFAATVADRRCVMERGMIVDMIENAQLDASMDKLHEYLGV